MTRASSTAVAGAPSSCATRRVLRFVHFVAVVASFASNVRAQEVTAREPELVSLLGRPLYARADTAGLIAKADSALGADPGNVELVIAAGNARASAWRYREAIRLYTEGIARYPAEPRLYRYRGHRFISLRRFEDAVRDLERAAALDSLSYDIAYHLGLARYLRGEFDKAAETYGRCMALAERDEALALEASAGFAQGTRSCMAIATSDDDRVAITDWRYRALRRAGRDSEAQRLLNSITEGMQVKENTAYYGVLLVTKGSRSESELLDESASDPLQFATVGYGIANWHLVNGDTARAMALLERIVEGEYWPAFGFIAAEVDVARKAPR